MKPIFSLFIFLFLFIATIYAQESPYKEKPKPLGAKRPTKAYQEKRQKGKSAEELVALEKFASDAENRAYDSKQVASVKDYIDRPWTDTSRLFPIFIGCIILFAILLGYNYLMGLTADKEKILKQLEATAKADEEAHRKKMLAR